MMNEAKQIYRIKGMDCAECARTIEAGVARLEGVASCSLNYAAARLTVEGKIAPENVIERVRALGYAVDDGAGDAADTTPSYLAWLPERGLGGFVRYLLARRATAFALLGALLILPGLIFDELLPMLGWSSPLLSITSLAALGVAGYPIARSAWQSLRINRRITINLLMTLAAVGWRKRPWAWIGIAAALLLGLVLPWFLLGRGDASIAWLRQGVLPSDMQWTSGPLHSAHGSLEMECEACHVQPFRRVRNEACLDCHAPALHQHLPADHPATPAMAADRCTSCHVEHDEPSNLIQTDSRLCTDCHAAPLDHGANAGALSVTDFSSAHPDFRVSLLKAPDFKVERLRLGEAKLIESSNLEFTHAAHLVAGGIKAPQGKVVMQCSDCHTPQPGGAAFEPINMERHCSSCHTLGFDPAEPDRKLPHGDPKLVMQTLLDHYSRRYLDGYSDAGISAVRSAPPGASMSSAGRARALGGARERAMKVAEDIFERRVCADCHTVSRLGTAGATEWVVAPVKLTQTFMPKAQFDHAAHATSESTCTDCHAATESKTAADVLMPGIAVCRDCHGGESGTEGKVARVPSPCASCHVFHDNNEPLWVPLMQKTLRQAAAKQ